MEGKAWRKLILFLGRGLTPAVLVTLGMGLLGSLAVFNATFHTADPYHFVFLHSGWLLVSLIFLIGFAAMPPYLLRSLTIVGSIVCYFLLWSVLWHGTRVAGGIGWFDWAGFSLYPAELAKPFFVLSLAMVLERTHKWRDDWCGGTLLPFLLVFVWLLPIILQPDYGPVLIYILTFFIVFYCAGGGIRRLFLNILLFAPLLAVLIRFGPLLFNRASGFGNGGAGLSFGEQNVSQVQHFLAEGGFFGHSMGVDAASRVLLPLAESSSVFATFGQAAGLLGLVSLLMIVMGWVLYGCRLTRMLDKGKAGIFPAAAVSGITVMIALQAVLHFTAVLGLSPSFELKLPFLSYGGSALLAVFMMIGLTECCKRLVPPSGIMNGINKNVD